MEKGTRSLAKCTGFDFVIEDHGCPFLSGAFDYEDGGTQGFGYVVDTAFLVRLMEALGTDTLKGTKGKSCWVTHTNSNISKIEPLHKKDGVTFDVAKWSKWHEQNVAHLSCPIREDDK